ncbi:MAG: hypothetical protein LHW41_06080 [Candidatus Cloacimonetes bacterium]|jgi:hypothetical protein|nr:hypothetical protein [Candidatus Cloacimonadota bacterium]
MNDSILARSHLEGLVHELNNHLNLILGCAQRLSKSHPELQASCKIDNARIMIYNLLKDLACQCAGKAFEQDIRLNHWCQFRKYGEYKIGG